MYAPRCALHEEIHRAELELGIVGRHAGRNLAVDAVNQIDVGRLAEVAAGRQQQGAGGGKSGRR